jgi:hypothetical protein
MSAAGGGGWISVGDAAILASRASRTIYSWIEKGHLQSQKGPDGVIRVWGRDVLKADATIGMGRPRGTARPGGSR